MIIERISKSILAFCVGLFCFTVGYNNIISYDLNFQFVSHVLSMDSMHSWAEGHILYSRQILSEKLHHVAYWSIICFEILSGTFCLAASGLMFFNLKNERFFQYGRNLFTIGATLGLLLWYFGFLIVGAEWFTMWLNQYNSQQISYQFSTFILLSLVYISRRETK